MMFISVGVLSFFLGQEVFMITALTFNKRENFLLACKKGQAGGAAWNPCISLSFFDFYIIARFFGTPGVLFHSRASILDFRCFHSPFFV